MFFVCVNCPVCHLLNLDIDTRKAAGPDRLDPYFLKLSLGPTHDEDVGILLLQTLHHLHRLLQTLSEGSTQTSQPEPPPLKMPFNK